MRIIPVLAAVAVVAGALIPPGVTLMVFFSGPVLLVLWLERRARLPTGLHFSVLTGIPASV